MKKEKSVSFFGVEEYESPTRAEPLGRANEGGGSSTSNSLRRVPGFPLPMYDILVSFRSSRELARCSDTREGRQSADKVLVDMGLRGPPPTDTEAQ